VAQFTPRHWVPFSSSPATRRATVDSIRTSQETHVSAAKINQLIQFKGKTAVYCENNMKYTNTLCRQNAKFWYVKAGGTCSDHWALKG
jgi:hypothetical protein